MIRNFFPQSSISYSNELISILRLIRSENIGPKTFYNLIGYYGSPLKALENLPEFIRRSNSKIKIFSHLDALKEIDNMEKEGAKFVSYLDKEYSPLLSKIDNAPPILSYKGNLNLFARDAVAIVGARNCSLAGKQIAAKIARELSQNDIIVASGLARGIDTEAHQASKPNTIAVIAGGIDNIYPPENHRLYKEISEKGLLIAELPVGSVPLAKHFPQRNRIISGLASCTVVIEAGINSGSLITANFALEQNREIFACPGFPLDPRCKGSNKLIKDGANLLESSEEIVALVKSNKSKLMDESKKEINIKPLFDKVEENFLNYSNRTKVFESLSATGCSIDEIASQIELPLPIIITILLEFELQGKITCQGDRYFVNF